MLNVRSIIVVSTMRTFRPFLAAVIVCLLAFPAAGQQAGPVQRLRIIALEGQRAVNYIPIRTTTAPVVEVRDENDRPVEGATVVFKLPDSGPGGTFEGGQTTQTGITDFRGQVGARGYTSNSVPGRFVIEVNATYEDRSARLPITQTNSIDALPPELGGPKKSSRKKWILLSVAAGAGAGVALYLLTGRDKPISVGGGPVSVGGPR